MTTVSARIDGDAKAKLAERAELQGESINAYVARLIDRDLVEMTNSTGNPGNDAVQCPECGALTAREAFQRHFDSLHKRSMSESEFGDIIDRVIESRDGKKFSEPELKIAKGIFTELKSKGFIK